MKQAELKRKLKSAIIKQDAMADGMYPEKDNPSVIGCYYESRGQARAFYSVMKALENDSIDLNIAGRN